MFLCNVVDQLLDEHGLTYSGSTEETDLSSLEIRLEKIDDLDTCEEHLLRGSQVLELRRLPVDRECAFAVEFLHSVDGLADNVHHAASDLRADRHCDRRTCALSFHSAIQSVCTVHRYCTHGVLADVLLHFDDEALAVSAIDCEGFVNSRKLAFRRFVQIEMNIDHRADDLRNMTFEYWHKFECNFSKI